MSRSKHTDPRFIRAARRVRAPFQARQANDLSLRRRHGRIIKRLGAPPVSGESVPAQQRPGPRIITRRPRRGFHHPANKKQVLRVLEAVGPVGCYGVRSVELVRRPGADESSALTFGRYEAPGRILLFEQPLRRWRLAGLLAAEDALRLKRAGAQVTPDSATGATLIGWPEGALRRFMLEEVLLHELGHHVLQHENGRRAKRIARTQDHEAFAARFAARQRLALRARGLRSW